MKQYVKQHGAILLGLLAFVLVFSRYFLFLVSVDVLDIYRSLPIDYTSILTTILGIVVSSAVFYYIPALIVIQVKAVLPQVPAIHPTSTIRTVVANVIDIVIPLYKRNNVIRC